MPVSPGLSAQPTVVIPGHVDMKGSLSMTRLPASLWWLRSPKKELIHRGPDTPVNSRCGHQDWALGLPGIGHHPDMWFCTLFHFSGARWPLAQILLSVESSPSPDCWLPSRTEQIPLLPVETMWDYTVQAKPLLKEEFLCLNDLFWEQDSEKFKKLHIQCQR
jgi:hypothetical protein